MKTVHYLIIEFFYKWVKLSYKIKVREHRRGNQKWTVQRNWEHMVHKMKKNKTKYNTTGIGYHYT
jgi:hypothetical protein